MNNFNRKKRNLHTKIMINHYSRSYKKAGWLVSVFNVHVYITYHIKWMMIWFGKPKIALNISDTNYNKRIVTLKIIFNKEDGKERTLYCHTSRYLKRIRLKKDFFLNVKTHQNWLFYYLTPRINICISSKDIILPLFYHLQVMISKKNRNWHFRELQNDVICRPYR